MTLREELERLAEGMTGQPMMREVLLRVAETAANLALEAAAKRCENLTYGVDINQWEAMTKKGHAAHACRECAAAIRAMRVG